MLGNRWPVGIRRIAAIALLLVLVGVTERLGAALYFRSLQLTGQHYAVGWVHGWRGMLKVKPNGELTMQYPFVLLMRFQVPPGKYVPRAPHGFLSKLSHLSSVSGWELSRKVAPKGEPSDVYLLTVETSPRLLFGNWAISHAVWLERDESTTERASGCNEYE